MLSLTALQYSLPSAALYTAARAYVRHNQMRKMNENTICIRQLQLWSTWIVKNGPSTRAQSLKGVAFFRQSVCLFQILYRQQDQLSSLLQKSTTVSNPRILTAVSRSSMVRPTKPMIPKYSSIPTPSNTSPCRLVLTRAYTLGTCS